MSKSFLDILAHKNQEKQEAVRKQHSTIVEVFLEHISCTLTEHKLRGMMEDGLECGMTFVPLILRSEYAQLPNSSTTNAIMGEAKKDKEGDEDDLIWTTLRSQDFRDRLLWMCKALCGHGERSKQLCVSDSVPSQYRATLPEGFYLQWHSCINMRGDNPPPRNHVVLFSKVQDKYSYKPIVQKPRMSLPEAYRHVVKKVTFICVETKLLAPMSVFDVELDRCTSTHVKHSEIRRIRASANHVNDDVLHDMSVGQAVEFNASNKIQIVSVDGKPNTKIYIECGMTLYYPNFEASSGRDISGSYVMLRPGFGQSGMIQDVLSSKYASIPGIYRDVIVGALNK